MGLAAVEDAAPLVEDDLPSRDVPLGTDYHLSRVLALPDNRLYHHASTRGGWPPTAAGPAADAILVAAERIRRCGVRILELLAGAIHLYLRLWRAWLLLAGIALLLMLLATIIMSKL